MFSGMPELSRNYGDFKGNVDMVLEKGTLFWVKRYAYQPQIKQILFRNVFHGDWTNNYPH